MTTEDDVKAASEKFYAALNRMLNGDAGPLSQVWSHDPNVTTMHPIGGREIGWDEVGRSWEQVAELATKGEVALADQFIQVAGDVAYELGVERGQFSLGGEEVAIEARVTNIYRRDSGDWKVVHHHADTTPAMIEVLGRVTK